MAESDLSSEVTGITALPAPSGVSGSFNSSNDSISVSWTNNDDSSDGGIDVERSSDGGSTYTTVASGLAPSATSYEDTTITVSESYEYRVERQTDHTTTTSSPSATIATRNQIGTAKIDGGDSTLTVPIYSTDTVSDNWLRVELSDGTVGALQPVAKSGEPLRVEKGGTVYGVKTQ